MKCPHCREVFRDAWSEERLRVANVRSWVVRHTQCPGCDNIIVVLRGTTSAHLGETIERTVWPPAATRPLAPEVPAGYRTEFAEAVAVLPESPKASAAVSRRCLQRLLREHGGITRRDLDKEIQELLDSRQLPSWLAEDVDAVRQVGNFAAHPIKSTNTGEIVDVEQGEAEWLLDVLEGLFDFYFVAPAAAQRRRDGLNARLNDAGKPPLKTPPA